MKIGLVSDSKCYLKKESLKRHIETTNISFNISDLGVYNELAEIHYEQLAKTAVDFLYENKKAICILVDITGSGISMFANKFEGIKAVTCFNVLSTKEALKEYDANMFAISSLTSLEEAIQIIDLILNYNNELAE